MPSRIHSSSLPLSSNHLIRHLKCVRNDGRVVSVRYLQLAVVIVLVLLALPLCFDSWKGGAAISTTMAIGDRLWCPIVVGVKDTSVRAIKVTMSKVWGGGPFANPVTSVLANIGEDVGTDVPTAQSIQVPATS
jgi:hypothetical protein